MAAVRLGDGLLRFKHSITPYLMYFCPSVLQELFLTAPGACNAQT